MRFHKSEEGQALVLTAICMTVLMGFLGLGIDVGLLFQARQRVQTAADAAAIAAALDYLYNGSATTAQAAGQAAATANGFTNGSNGVQVTINVPPASGPDQSGNFAEAVITDPSPTNFMPLFGFSTITVAGRAVAGQPEAGNACIWLMATSGTALSVQGSYDFNLPNCGIYVNSPDSDAVTVTGNGGTVNAAFLDVVGNTTPQHQTTPTPITSNAAARKSPWGNLTGPSVPGGCTQTSSATSITTANETSVSASSSNSVVCFTSAVTLNDGVSLPGAPSGVIYVFEDGVTIATGATVTLGSATYDSSSGTFSNTSGAAMEIYGGTLNQDSNSILNVYSPTAGPYNGIAILQPSTNTNTLQVQFGSNNEVLDGYIYAPGAQVYLQDSGGGITASGIVAKTMSNQTSSVTISSYDAANYQTTPNRIVSLVE
jgi:hypothetical protein